MQRLDASKNTDIKTLIDHLHAAVRNQLQQTPSSKIGGGGARAARRIRIRRPRRAAEGLEACRIHARTSADSKASDGPRPIRRPPLQIPPKTHVAVPRTPKSEISADSLPIENPSKIGLLKIPSQIAKIGSVNVETSILASFWDPFWHQFSMIFQLIRKSVNP